MLLKDPSYTILLKHCNVFYNICINFKFNCTRVHVTIFLINLESIFLFFFIKRTFPPPKKKFYYFLIHVREVRKEIGAS